MGMEMKTLNPSKDGNSYSQPAMGISLIEFFWYNRVYMEGLFVYVVIILFFYAIGSLSRKREQRIENAFKRITNLFKGTPEKNQPDPVEDLDRNITADYIDGRDNAQIKIFQNQYKITDREWEITRLVCDGMSNREIEDQLFISLATVKDHVHNILKKTGVKNRIQLVNLVRNSSIPDPK